MIVALTLLVRDEVDIVGENIAYHLAAGVDVVIATDHRSTDGTTEILEDYASTGKLALFREEQARIRQSDWVTRMARRAAREFGADWVINCDADAFWWPRCGTLKQALELVPEWCGLVYGLQQDFVPRPGDGWFADRMTTRFAPEAPVNDPTSSLRPAAQVVHRGDPDIEVIQGNHGVRGTGLRGLRAWHPLEILHFPFRTPEQCARKHRNTIEAWERNLRGDLARARSLLESGRERAYWERLVVDDAALRRGLSDGCLVDDTRVRDALRAIRAGSRDLTTFFSARSTPSPSDDASLAIQGAALASANMVRVRQWLDGVENRLRALEGHGQ